ncbi:MAG TPA: response regulator [Bacteroidia bacterium]|nr:response regulator [Bacteroidia bacterium]
MTLARKILVGFITCALVLCGVAVFSFKNGQKFISSNDWVNHTHQVLYEYQEILVSSVDAETGVRGFVITGNENFLEPFSDASTNVIEHLEKIKKLTKDNSSEQKNIEKLEGQIKISFSYLNRCIELRKTGFDKARELVATGEGKQIEDGIRATISNGEELEQTLLTERKQTSDDDASKFNQVFVILMLIIILILVIVYVIITTNLRTLKKAEAQIADKNWLLTGNTELNDKLIGDQTLEVLANNMISILCNYLKANIGAVYLFNDKDNELVLTGRYAFSAIQDVKHRISLNEGLVGQAVHERKQISVTDVTDEQIRITSSILSAKPKNILISPFFFAGKTMGVIEIGRLKDFNEIEKKFLSVSMDSIAISVNTALGKKNIENLNIELKGKEQQLSNQINAINKSNASVEFDTDGTILSANERFLNLLGYKESEIIGKHHSILVEKGYAASKEYHQFWDSLRKGEFQQGEFKRVTKTGEIVWLQGSYNPLLDSSGRTYKILKIATDCTLAKKQEIELAQQSEELQVQQEELKQMNEELEEQTRNLKQQQEELQMTNEELEEQTQSLEEKNREVEASKNDIEQKTKQLEISSKYKSEFLANMSHELRTPLNSLLILSKDLSENRKKNLDSIQVESAEIIYKSGHDLLILINEVLDLSKIEAGKMSINVERLPLKDLANGLMRDFKHMAEEKGLKLTCNLGKGLPESILTDPQRLNQILKNLLSNAIKFTEKGSVNINIDCYDESKLIISISDTGIGIVEDKQMAVFEAFQQAEGGTSRKYGGTGLGLSISRQLAKLLGSEIKLSSKLNEGSTFSLIIPLEIQLEEGAGEIITVKPLFNKPIPENRAKYLNYPGIADDRNILSMDDKIVLIIEDDLRFASILLKQANNSGFKCLCATTGEDGLLLAAKYKPQAIILDMSLPGINGHNVLHELKVDPSVRHIPVHIISSNERSLETIKEGAVEYLMKPIDKKDMEKTFTRIENFISRKIKNLLIIEDSEGSRKAMRVLIGNGDVECFEAGNGKDALIIYEQNQIDCIILDIGLPDMTGFDFIHKMKDIKSRNIPPIIVYTGKELTKEENNELQKYAESIIIKGVKSEERLLDETALFLHRTISNLPKSKQLLINSLHDKEAVFHSKTILVVDDDTRNVFALSQILKERGMEIVKAENGKHALEMLDAHSEINLVLMDIMMPEMDGYEAMRRIRANIRLKNLPVIALTAKAMKDDKQKCIDAGANDYITKPIDVERLLSLMRVWLSK